MCICDCLPVDIIYIYIFDQVNQEKCLGAHGTPEDKVLTSRWKHTPFPQHLSSSTLTVQLPRSKRLCPRTHFYQSANRILWQSFW